MYVNPNVFKAYDIRGDFPEEINPQSVYTIARSFAEFLRGGETKPKRLTVVVANDGRPSSPELKKAVLEALLDEGVTVLDMGFSTSPFHYFTVTKTRADGGVMVTASHDPQKMNGLKLSRKGAEPLGDGMEVLANIAKRGIFQAKEERGQMIKQSFNREYIEFLFSQVDLSKVPEDFKIVIDAGGGMISILLPLIIKKIPCRSIVINSEMDYASAYKSLDPHKEEDLAALKNEVLKERADFGVAFDQDGDRTGFVTRNARFFRSDYVGAYFAREFLRKSEGARIVHDVRSSSIFRETILKNGGKALESRVGHSLIKRLMRKEEALFGAELSGHFYFKNFYYLDSDFLPLLYFLEFLSGQEKSTDEILAEFEIYPSSGELRFKSEGKETVLDKIAAAFPDAKETKWIDGLSIYYDDWWANIRPSNTESLIELNVEARTQELLDEKLRALTAFLK